MQSSSPRVLTLFAKVKPTIYREKVRLVLAAMGMQMSRWRRHAETCERSMQPYRSNGFLARPEISSGDSIVG